MQSMSDLEHPGIALSPSNKEFKNDFDNIKQELAAALKKIDELTEENTGLKS